VCEILIGRTEIVRKLVLVGASSGARGCSGRPYMACSHSSHLFTIFVTGALDERAVGDLLGSASFTPGP